MRVFEEHFIDVTMTCIETQQNDGPALTRTEGEHLREVVRSLQASDRHPKTVAVSLPMFDRMLKAMAIGLLYGTRE